MTDRPRHSEIIFSPCRVCGEKTSVIVNIKLTATPVCERCCRAIAVQTVVYLVRHAPYPGEEAADG